MQDSPTDPVSVNYCQLSAPGYKEEQLRRGDTAALGGSMEEFTIEEFICSSCSPCNRRNNGFGGLSNSNECNTYYDIDSWTLTPNTSAHFSFEGRYLVAKSPGFYGISVSVQMQVYQGNTMIITSREKHSFVRLETGDKISIKTTHSLMASTEGSKLFIAMLS